MVYSFSAHDTHMFNSDVYKNAPQANKDQLDRMAAEWHVKTAGMVREDFEGRNIVFCYRMSDAWGRQVCRTEISRASGNNAVCERRGEDGQILFTVGADHISELTKIAAAYAGRFKAPGYAVEYPDYFDGWMHCIYITDGTDSFYFDCSNLQGMAGKRKNDYPCAAVLIAMLREVFDVLAGAGIERRYYSWWGYDPKVGTYIG